MTREEAVNELNDRIKSAEYVDSDYIDCVSVDAVKMTISALNVPDTNVGDTISRQAAIDICRAPHMRNADCSDFEMAIMMLPPAQPQRTCVNCGRTANNGGWYADGRTRCQIEEHYALPKDGYCHLWEKRNVTDDDYPERREE